MLLGGGRLGKREFRQLLIDSRGQDVVEYALLIGFLVLSSAALYIEASDVIDRLWINITTRLAGGG